MQVIVNDLIHNSQHMAYSGNAGFVAGSSSGCQVLLNKSRYVYPRHLIFDREDSGWVVSVSPEATPVTVDGQQLSSGNRYTLRPISEINLPGYSLIISQHESDDAPGKSNYSQKELDINRIQREIHQKVIDNMELRNSSPAVLDSSLAELLGIGLQVDKIIHANYQSELGPEGYLRVEMLSLAVGNRLLLYCSGYKKERVDGYEIPGHNPVLEKLARDYDALLAEKLEVSPGEEITGDEFLDISVKVDEISRRFAGQMPENLQMYLIGRHIKKVVCDLIFGFGPLQDILDMPGVSEIMVVSPTQVYVEQNGIVRKTNCTFLGTEALMAVLERIVSPLGRRVDRSTPLVDARLPDGSRVNAIIPPLALKGPCLTIRRFPKESINWEKLLKWGAFTPQALELMKGLIAGRKNIIVAGGTGSGKTTMLNVLSSFIGEKERIVTIEDSAELQLQHEHLVSLETRPENVEGKGEITIRDLIKNALRMRPDRIIVGECRGAEAFDMLQAMNTGHNGSMTTIHANSPMDVMTRLQSMCLMAVDIPLQSIRQQIEQAIDLIVFLERLPTGQRMVTAIAELDGINPKTDEIVTRIVMKANYSAKDNKYVLQHNGYIPSVLPELAAKGFVNIKKVFEDDGALAGEVV